MKNNPNYQEQINIENQRKLNNVLDELPRFCQQFFRGIEYRTSSRTRIAYGYDILLFFQYLLLEHPKINYDKISQITLDDLNLINSFDIENYIDYLKLYEKEGRNITNAEAGIMRKLASVRTFFNYFYKHKLIQQNPPSQVTTPKKHTKEIIRLDYDEVAILLDEVEDGTKLTEKQKEYHNKNKIRDLALMTLLLGTGLRVSECVGINIKDIDFDNDGVRVHRKGGNEVIVYFGYEVHDALMDYYELRKTMSPAEGHEEAFFLSMQMKRLSVRSVENLVKKYASIATPLKHITPHKLRSTYGTNLYKETSDIYLVADVLGHKDVNTTRKHYAAQEDYRRKQASSAVTLREKNNK